jgi:hypothetical protein
MASLTASDNPIAVDLNQATEGPSTVTYAKHASDELWRRHGGSSSWEFIPDPAVLPGFKAEPGNPPEAAGSFVMTLKPGAVWEFGIFEQDHGPDQDPTRLAHLVLFAIANRPKDDLIESEDWTTGGTWHSHFFTTKRPTHAVVHTASLDPPTMAAGFPISGEPDGTTPGGSYTLDTDHNFSSKQLLAGRDHTFLVVVIDANGHWDFRATSFTTKRRKITVQFETLHVFNDSDENTVGDDAEFTFGVSFWNDDPTKRDLVEAFTRPGSDIDDWSETDRPYKLGYAHVGQFEAVQEGQRFVFVWSKGDEDDSEFFMPDTDWARSRATILDFPSGQGENVSNEQFQLDCPAGKGDLHYGVDIVWSVEYDN